MVSKFRAACLGVLALTMVALATAPSATGADGASSSGCTRHFEAVSHAFDQAFIDRDFDAFMAFIADDAVQIDFLGNVFLGKEEIAAFTRAVMTTRSRTA
jgi:ketosteroid isomerase-like protein